jgi:hypothetical protein
MRRAHVMRAVAILSLIGAVFLASPVSAGCEYWQCAQYSDPVYAQCELRFGAGTGDYAIACRTRCYRYSDGSIAYCGCSYDYCYAI